MVFGDESPHAKAAVDAALVFAIDEIELRRRIARIQKPEILNYEVIVTLVREVVVGFVHVGVHSEMNGT